MTNILYIAALNSEAPLETALIGPSLGPLNRTHTTELLGPWRISIRMTYMQAGLAINRSWVQILLWAKLRNNLGQVVHTYVPLSPSNITWYRPSGGDAVQLGR